MSVSAVLDVVMNFPVDDQPFPTAKDYHAPSLFEPANMLREARRQKGLPDVAVPTIGLLDPDGDIVAHLATSGRGRRHPGWACYHTEMWVVDLDGIDVGVIGMAVGAPFAVLVAEQLAASGAELVVSITSAGQITPIGATPCFVLIDRALRDEGTSSHYVAPARWSRLDEKVLARLDGAFDELPEPVVTGSSWTTDAPYRETAAAIAAAEAEGIACVEMEAAALYATPQPGSVPWSVWPTSPTRWPPTGTTLRKVPTTVYPPLLPSPGPWRPHCSEQLRRSGRDGQVRQSPLQHPFGQAHRATTREVSSRTTSCANTQ